MSKDCINCKKSGTLVKFIDLGTQPNGNVFPSADQLNQEQQYPLAMLVCTNCWQVQLASFPAVDEMFINHPYITGLNQPVVHHFEKLAKHIIEKFTLSPHSLVLDIGANDGTLLTKFKAHQMRVIGIDPCRRSYEIAKNQGITIFRTFWNKESAAAMKKLGLSPDLITATAVFYHLEDLHSFVEGLSLIMDTHTVFCAQCVYLKEVIEKLQFDHFYHEHTMIHAIGPLKSLFTQYGLKLLDVEMYPIHGGSFVLYVGREEGPFPVSTQVDDCIAAEKNGGLEKLQTYFDFAHRINQNSKELKSLLHEIVAQGKRVFGLGAPLKGNTLLNYFNIGPDLVEYVIDINEHKVGKFTPGMHIPIIHEDEVAQQPDYYLVLSWNYLDFFIEKYAHFLMEGGKFILPHPTVSIITQESLMNRQGL